MTTTLIPVASREEWLADRVNYLGSSESPAVLGCGYSGENAHTVWLRKIGAIEEIEDNDRLLCGRLLQDGITRIIAHKTGYDIRPAEEFGIIRSKEHPWLGCTPDNFIHGDPRGLGVCEIKNVDHYLMRDWRSDQPPLRPSVQIQHQFVATGATWGIVGAIIGGNRPVWFEMTLHSRLIDAMIPALRAFWRHVETRTPPPVDASAGCTAALKALYPQDSGLSKPLPADACGWFDELSGLKRLGKWLEGRRTLVENRIRHVMGEATEGTLPDGRRFTWKTQNREGYIVAPGTMRVLRQHGKTPDDAPESRVAECTKRLLGLGATIVHESESGSRYFELAGGLTVRVSDHAPNENTTAWMDRREVASVRVDLETWTDELEGIVGPSLESEGD